MLTLRQRNNIARIEVHVRTKGFRIVVPKLSRQEKPFVLWGRDPHQAWEEVKMKATQKLDELHGVRS